MRAAVADLLRGVGQRVAADQVEDGVDRLGQLPADRPGGVVEHLGGAGVAQEAVVARARRADDVRAERDGDLDGVEARRRRPPGAPARGRPRRRRAPRSAPGRRSARPAAAPRPRRRTATPACARGSAAARARARPPSPTGRRRGGRSRTPRRRARRRPPRARPPRRRRRRPSPGRSGSGAGRRRQPAGADAQVDRVDPGGVHPHQHGVRARRAARAGRRAAQDVVVPEPVVGHAAHAVTGGPSRTGRTPSGSRGGSRARRGRAACRRTSCPWPARGWP